MNINTIIVSSMFFIGACADSSDDGASGPGGGGKSDSPTAEIEVVARTQVAKLDAQVACVESFNAESESNGIHLYFHLSSYPQAKMIQDSGLTTMVLGGDATCDSEGGTLPYVVVGEYDNASEINAAIVAAGGYEDALVLFYNRDELDSAFRTSTALALSELD